VEPALPNMTLRAAVLVLVSALLHAVWNALIKHEKDPRSAGLAVLAVATISATVLALLARQVAFPNAAGLRWAVGAGLCEGAYFVALGLALAHGPLGPAYTVARGGAMLVAWPISVLFLGEAFSWPARVGVVLIGTGLAFTTLRPREQASPGGLGWAALSAVCIAGYHLCYKVALAAGAESRALFAVALGCALPINLASMGRHPWKGGLLALRRSPLRMAIGGLTCTASFIVLLQALAVAGAGAVLTLRNTSVLFAQAFAIWGGEPPNRRVIGGAILVVAGALLLTR
jgi:drug/metabolite transporter (DMT)-like permease